MYTLRTHINRTIYIYIYIYIYRHTQWRMALKRHREVTFGASSKICALVVTSCQRWNKPISLGLSVECCKCWAFCNYISLEWDWPSTSKFYELAFHLFGPKGPKRNRNDWTKLLFLDELGPGPSLIDKLTVQKGSPITCHFLSLFSLSFPFWIKFL